MKGIGLHATQLSDDQATEATEFSLITQALTILIAPFCRVAVIALVLQIPGRLPSTVRDRIKAEPRLLELISKAARYTLWGLGVSNVFEILHLFIPERANTT